MGYVVRYTKNKRKHWDLIWTGPEVKLIATNLQNYKMQSLHRKETISLSRTIKKKLM